MPKSVDFSYLSKLSLKSEKETYREAELWHRAIVCRDRLTNSIAALICLPDGDPSRNEALTDGLQLAEFLADAAQDSEKQVKTADGAVVPIGLALAEALANQCELAVIKTKAAPRVDQFLSAANDSVPIQGLSPNHLGPLFRSPLTQDLVSIGSFPNRRPHNSDPAEPTANGPTSPAPPTGGNEIIPDPLEVSDLTNAELEARLKTLDAEIERQRRKIDKDSNTPTTSGTDPRLVLDVMTGEREELLRERQKRLKEYYDFLMRYYQWLAGQRVREAVERGQTHTGIIVGIILLPFFWTTGPLAGAGYAHAGRAVAGRVLPPILRGAEGALAWLGKFTLQRAIQLGLLPRDMALLFWFWLLRHPALLQALNRMNGRLAHIMRTDPTFIADVDELIHDLEQISKKGKAEPEDVETAINLLEILRRLTK
jgi:uncharacterized small protein (DUF1192 family)